MTRLRKIKSVAPAQGHRLDVTWADDTHSLVDLSVDVVAGDGVFAALLDPIAFRSVRVGDRARTVEWRLPSDGGIETLVDIDADALFAMAEPAAKDGWEASARV